MPEPHDNTGLDPLDVDRLLLAVDDEDTAGLAAVLARVSAVEGGAVALVVCLATSLIECYEEWARPHDWRTVVSVSMNFLEVEEITEENGEPASPATGGE